MLNVFDLLNLDGKNVEDKIVQSIDEVKEEILRLHDYDICEIASYDLEQGSDSFLNWVEYETK